MFKLVVTATDLATTALVLVLVLFALRCVLMEGRSCVVA